MIDTQKQTQQALTSELEHQKALCEELQTRPDPTTVQQQCAQLEMEIEDGKQAVDLARQELEVAQRSVRELSETNDSLTSQLNNVEADREQKVAELNSLTSELAQHANLIRTAETQKNEILGLTQSLASSTEASNSQIAELKAVVEQRDRRIQELESTLQTPSQPPVAPSQISGLHGDALLKIEEALRQQNDRMATLEEINQQSLNKIEEIQSAPSRRTKKRDSLPEGHEDLSEIQGVGPKFRQKLFDLGVKTISQIAQWNETDRERFAEQIGCGQRTINQWVERAKELSSRS